MEGPGGAVGGIGLRRVANGVVAGTILLSVPAVNLHEVVGVAQDAHVHEVVVASLLWLEAAHLHGDVARGLIEAVLYLGLVAALVGIGTPSGLEAQILVLDGEHAAAGLALGLVADLGVGVAVGTLTRGDAKGIVNATVLKE